MLLKNNISRNQTITAYIISYNLNYQLVIWSASVKERGGELRKTYAKPFANGAECFYFNRVDNFSLSA